LGKIVKNSTNLTDKQTEKLVKIKQELETRQEAEFLPSPSQRAAKSRFWVRYDKALLGEPETLSLAAIARVVKDNRLDKWFSQSGFREWFLNQDEAKERLDYIWNLGLDRIEAILQNDESNPNAQVNAFKQISILAGKEPQKNQEFTDEDIQRMPKEKLKAYIEKHAVKFLPAPTSSNLEDKDVPEVIKETEAPSK
jgi:hypothetical protein